MIIDILDNADLYAGLNPRFPAAFAFLRRADLAELPEGRHDLEDGLYAMIAKGPGRKVEDALIETHDHYIDLAYLVSGVDRIGWKPRRDLAFYADAPTHWSEVGPGMIAAYFPEDAHMPMIGDNEMHKIVVKIRI
jgi:YhcH/YjgK/YiaL family protein